MCEGCSDAVRGVRLLAHIDVERKKKQERKKKTERGKKSTQRVVKKGRPVRNEM